MARPRRRPAGGEPAPGVRHPAVGAAGGHRLRHGPPPAQPRGARRVPRAHGGKPPQPLLRPRRRRRRAGGPRGGGVRGVRGPADTDAGQCRLRRPGGDELEDRELLRLPPRHLRRRSHPARAGAGREVRRPAERTLRGERAAGGGRPSRHQPLRWHARRRAGGDHGIGRPLPAARGRSPPGVRGERRVLRRHRRGGAPVRREPGRGRRWRQLRRTGGGVPRRPGKSGDRGHQRAGARRPDVPLPRRPAGEPPQCPGHDPDQHRPPRRR